MVRDPGPLSCIGGRRAEQKGDGLAPGAEYEGGGGCDLPGSGEFRGRFDEIELLMFPSEGSVELILQIDRRARGLGSFLSEAVGTDESYASLTVPESASPERIAEALSQTIRQHA